MPADDRLELLKDSYKEILDATKHQDEKIGYMLTAVAFLTAAALALADFGPGQAISTKFRYRGTHLHDLALLALLVFLVTVVFGVALLILSLATPLSEASLSRPKSPKSRRVSQIYFYEIAKMSGKAWRDKWEIDERVLKEESVDMYIRETHNLAVRTDFKYNRTTEATAILSFSLLALAFAVTLAIDGAASGCAPGSTEICSSGVEMTAPALDTLGVIIGSYVFLFRVMQLKYTWRSLEQVPYLFGREEDDWKRVRWKRISAVIVGAAAGLVVAMPFGRHQFEAVPDIGLLVLAATAEVVVNLPWGSERPYEKAGAGLVNLFSVLVAIGLLLKATGTGAYLDQLLAGGILALGPPAVMSITPSCRYADNLRALRKEATASTSESNLRP